VDDLLSKPHDPRQIFAASIVARLRDAGFEAYFAGGCVRDLLLGLEPEDYDVATDARPQEVMRLFRRTIAIGASFGVVKVLGAREEGDVEVATFRSDGNYLDGRRPETVTFSTAELDASRRDFTINGMFLDPVESRVIDFVGGRADLDAKILRAIGDPSARFTEDKLRLLRAVRFTARFGLTIDGSTRAAVSAMAAEVTTVSAERIAQELRKMLVHSSRSTSMRLAREAGLLAAVLPPLATISDESWEHTMRVLDRLQPSPSFPLAFAALLAGIDQATVRDVALSLSADLKLANADRDRTVWLLDHRGSLAAPETLRESTLKRLLASEGIDDLLALHRAEALASGLGIAHVEFCLAYLRDLPNGPIDPPPLLNGHDLMRHGLKPGPHFARLLEEVRDAQLDRSLTTKEEALALVDRLNAPPPDSA
jgi:poly(A) polymerase